MPVWTLTGQSASLVAEVISTKKQALKPAKSLPIVEHRSDLNMLQFKEHKWLQCALLTPGSSTLPTV